VSVLCLTVPNCVCLWRGMWGSSFQSQWFFFPKDHIIVFFYLHYKAPLLTTLGVILQALLDSLHTSSPLVLDVINCFPLPTGLVTETQCALYSWQLSFILAPAFLRLPVNMSGLVPGWQGLVPEMCIDNSGLLDLSYNWQRQLVTCRVVDSRWGSIDGINQGWILRTISIYY
jgi:hypothetical protein